MSSSYFHIQFNKLPHYPYNHNQHFKTTFGQKCKQQKESIINMNHSMAHQPNTAMKVIKKYSFQHKKNNTLIGSSKNIQRQKTVPKSKSVHNISKPTQNIKYQPIQSHQPKRLIREILKTKLQNQQKLYQWRTSSYFPLIKIKYIGQKQIIYNPSNQLYTQIQLELQWNQDIKYNLHQIQYFNLLNSLFIIDQSLVSFQRLYNKFGYFQPTINMVFITNQFKCKIWANQNIWENYPLPPKFVSKQHQKVQYFYKKVIKMFDKYFKSRTQLQNIKHKNEHNKNKETIKKSVNLIQKLMYQLDRKKDFIQGMKFINQFTSAYSLKINNRFIDSVQIQQNRSRIFTKLQNTNKNKKLQQIFNKGNRSQSILNKINVQNQIELINRLPDIQVRQTLPQIPYKNQIQNQIQVPIRNTLPQIPVKKQSSDLDQINIKTLKNSVHQYKQVIQSNIQTITNVKPIISNPKIITNKKTTKQIPFKKQSQVSIGSKLTVVQKKCRFSLHNNQKQPDTQPTLLNSLLPKFTNQDFTQQDNQNNMQITNINQNNINNQNQMQQCQMNNENNQNYEKSQFDINKITDEQGYQQQVRNQIQKNVRQKNGWLQSPLLLFDNDDCAKSYQDSQPSVKLKIRQRNLSKLNRIKTSIANSIID